LDRTEELLKHVTKGNRGIEIGPYHSPLAPRRLGFKSITLDVFDADELRRRAENDPHIPREHLPFIENVDLKGSAVDIADLVKSKYQDDTFDYVVSSHNFEHLPDPIRFLQGCERVLKPDGVLSMAVPDHRYCFDFYRPVTELSEWLDAYREQRKKPTPGQVFRHGASSSLLDGQIAWSPQSTGLPTPSERLDAAYANWQKLTKANGEGPYKDAHCSVFTPSSLELMIADLHYLGVLRLETIEISGPNGCEFFIHLRNPSGDSSRPDRANFYRRRAEIIRKAATEVTEEAVAEAFKTEADRYRNEVQLCRQALESFSNSTSWRVTAPLRFVARRIYSLAKAGRSLLDRMR
jgi:SAM-dependent methyltransferase